MDGANLACRLAPGYSKMLEHSCHDIFWYFFQPRGQYKPIKLAFISNLGQIENIFSISVLTI